MKLKRISIIISSIALALCIFTALVVVPKAYGNKLPNTPDHVYDESVNIPEPMENKGRVPDHIRWEPMLGLYVDKSAYYDAETKSFVFPMAPGDGIERETNRIYKWIENNRDTKNPLYQILIQYEDSLSAPGQSKSSHRQPNDNIVVQKEMIPSGAKYLDQMMDMVFTEKLFTVPLMYAIEQITSTKCQPVDQLYDDQDEPKEQWRASMKSILSKVEGAVKNNEDLTPYGIFALPYLADKRSDPMTAILPAIQKAGISADGTVGTANWITENKDSIETIRRCVEKYK